MSNYNLFGSYKEAHPTAPITKFEPNFGNIKEAKNQEFFDRRFKLVPRAAPKHTPPPLTDLDGELL